MKKKYIICLLALINSILYMGSTLASEHVEHRDLHGHHEESGFELGLSVGYAYLKEEKDKGAVLHAHIMKRLSGDGFQKYFSLGFGVETIFSNEPHYGAMITLAAHPTDNIILSLSPGIEWEKHEGKTESGYATHIEAAYVFETTHYHIDPVIGYSKTEDDEHYTIGIHIGVPL